VRPGTLTRRLIPVPPALAAWLLALAARAAEEEGGGTMPQFDPTTFAPQIVWLVICFAVLYLLLRRVALPRIAEVLEERQERIAGDLDKAAALKAEAEAVLADYEKASAEGRAAAQAALRQAAESMSAQSAKQHAELGEKLTADLKVAESRIAKARQEATDNVRTIAADIAQAATERLIGGSIEAAAAESAVRDAMKD